MQIIGNVVVGSGSSIWFGSVWREDNEPIVIGERISVQRGCILHSDPGSPLRIGNDTTVGHRATGTLSVNGRKVADSRIPKTVPFLFAMDDTFDVGEDWGTPVSSYRCPFKFTGILKTITIETGPSSVPPS